MAARSRRRRGKGGPAGGEAPLAAGLFAGLAGQSAPCSAPGCGGTATISPRARLSGLDPRAALCPPHHAAALDLADRELPCSVRGCRRTWTFTALEQLAALAPDGYDPDLPGEPAPAPARTCAPCQARRAKLSRRRSVCQVHGCTQEVEISVTAQLEAWAALGTDDTSAEPRPPRRMCRSCREFCRTHPDRELPCVRPECDGTWTFKSGAQLHARLDGAREEPARPCARCRAKEAQEGSIAGSGAPETMPCVNPGCDGTWSWTPGTRLRRASEGERPADRMCASCRDHAPAPRGPASPSAPGA